MLRLLFVSLIIFPLFGFSQFVDDFSNGNFTSNPPWVGDCERFIVEQQVLRLYDDRAGMAQLSTMSRSIHNTQWDFWVRLAFIPSDNNHARVYLVSDEPDLSVPLHGYFLQVGKTGTDNKRLFFFRQDGQEEVLLLTGTSNLATASNNIIRIRVFRDSEGNWELLADPGGGHFFLPEGAVFDNTYRETRWFGIKCTYTSSNARRFYFDHFRVGERMTEAPPEVVRVVVASAASLDVYFSRVVSLETAGSPVHYFADGGLGQPMIASMDPLRPYMVRLLFGRHFQPNHLYGLRVSGVESMDGQRIEPISVPFVYYFSERFDVVFNELMVNSRPPVSLPPHDWIELYNTTSLPINLENWVLEHNGTRREIPDVTISPGGFLVLTTEGAVGEMEQYGPVVGVPGLSINAFPQSRGALVLWDNKGNIISFVAYTADWYRDTSKANGGWSLEKIDPYNFCQGEENWMASTDPRGGTPAAANASFRHNPNTTHPDLFRAGFLDHRTIRLYFSEPMDADALSLPDLYTVTPMVGNPSLVHPVQPFLSSVDLILEEKLKEGVIYTVSAEGLFDCAGNELNSSSARVGVPEMADKGDVVINEVLFHPPAGGSRYVELYNRSDKVVELSGHLISSMDTLTGQLTSVRHLLKESYLLFPGDYCVLSNDVKSVKKNYLTPDPYAFLALDAMPSMSNSGGLLVFSSPGRLVIDSLRFSAGMHLPLLSSFQGVALERIHPDRPGHDPHNWHSASAASGFGTPGYTNSQYLSHKPDGPFRIKITPRVFAPDGSGEDDLLHIHYSMKENGYVANVRIFDRRGRMVRTLVHGELLGDSGFFVWDGTDNAGQKAPLGVYVIHVEFFNQHGRVYRKKHTAVLGTRL